MSKQSISKFLIAVKKCKGEVSFSTPEGDVLNLKSTISQHVLTTMYKDLSFINDGILQIEKREDYRVLAPYLKDNK